MQEASRQPGQVMLRSRVTCPHCWHRFAPQEILWISAHPDLRGDPVVGEDAQRRFLSDRFTAAGHAIDARGVSCTKLACPSCHLSIARALLEMQPLFVSLLGAPSSGKSYLLASMTWMLRSTLFERFRLAFQDADAASNQTLSNYEDILFQNPQDDQLVLLPKTQPEGEHYEPVTAGGREVWYPKPFVFSIQPGESHPAYEERSVYARVLCLYDNAGENFLPGQDTTMSPGTQHLALSRAILFVFDPTQHIQFRKTCQAMSQDPQLRLPGWAHRQDLVLQEAANRVRDYCGFSQYQKYAHPLIVIVNKFDVWRGLTRVHELAIESVVRPVREGISALDFGRLQSVSSQVRTLLMRYAGDIVAAAESFASHVLYVPVSALGNSPEYDERTGSLPIRPRNIRPMWAEVPMLYALSQAAPGLVRQGRHQAVVNENLGQRPGLRLAIPPGDPSSKSDKTDVQTGEQARFPSRKETGS